MPAEPTVSPLIQMVPYVLIVFIFYFVFFKPQKEQQKKQKELLSNLKKNDKVVTAGGMHGTVVNVKEKSVIIRVDDNVKIEFDKESVSTVTKS